MIEANQLQTLLDAINQYNTVAREIRMVRRQHMTSNGSYLGPVNISFPDAYVPETQAQLASYSRSIMHHLFDAVLSELEEGVIDAASEVGVNHNDIYLEPAE